MKQDGKREDKREGGYREENQHVDDQGGSNLQGVVSQFPIKNTRQQRGENQGREKPPGVTGQCDTKHYSKKYTHGKTLTQLQPEAAQKVAKPEEKRKSRAIKMKKVSKG